MTADPLSKTDDQLKPEAFLGISVEKVIDLWQEAGKPEIKTIDGKITDLEKLLSRPDVKPEHLQAVKVWLQENKSGE